MRRARFCASLVAACGVGLLLTVSPASAAGSPLTFTVTPDTIRADSSGQWLASLRVVNGGEWGIYPDSLSLAWKSTDQELSVAPREGVNALTNLLHVIQPAGTGETTGLDWNAPADFERGTLTFRIQFHDAKKTPYTLEKTIVVAGNDLFDLRPRVLVDAAGGRKVEVIHVPSRGETQPAPGLLYVPPAGVSARMTLRWAYQFVARGMAVTVVSLPGTGGSTGPSDRSGPESVAAVEAALASLAKQPGVDGKRLAIWGLGDGGSTALLAAARHPELKGVIAQNAEYDPWGAYRALSAADQAAFVKAVGRDSSSWRARSPGLAAQRIASPVLVLHNAGMSDGSRAAAEAFIVARAAKNLPSESRIEGAAGTPPGGRRDAARIASDFLGRYLVRP